MDETIDETNELELKFENFIKKVSETGIVWGLENDDGFAMSSSSEFEDEDGEPIELMCFWSEKKLADVCAKDEWKGYKTVQVELGDFLEHWCVGMANDGLVIGVDLDTELTGYEIDPLDLILEISDQLSAIGKTLKLKDYKSLDALVEEIESLDEEDEE
ncbi:MAG: DUF2750 domain-containing protein [Fibrobacter sp.]|nr:DUF2750 domain-containing protein [Fibrobacter sp.]